MLSKHFSKAELSCPCCGVCVLTAELLIALEELRSQTGPLKINSGYRCVKQNTKEGGAKSSEHVAGKAADVSCPKNLTLAQFYAMADKIPAFKNGGIGVYPKGAGQNTDFLHVDTRAKRARWARIEGKYVGVDVGLTYANTKGAKA